MKKLLLILLLSVSLFSYSNEQIRSMFRDGKYDGIVRILSRPSNAQENLYRGLAHYCLFLTPGGAYNYHEAVKYLTVASRSSNHSIRARALLNLGYIKHLRGTSLREKRIALSHLHEIQSIPALRNTASYNDSLLYSAIIYKQMGWYVQARRFYRLLENANEVDNVVYDPELRMNIPPKHAAQRGLFQLQQITNPR